MFYFANSSFAPEDADIVKVIANTKLFGPLVHPSAIIFVVIVICRASGCIRPSSATASMGGR